MVVVVELLLPGLGSVVEEVTVAVFVSTVPPGAVTVTTIETVAPDEAARVPRVAVTVPELKVQTPWVVVQETKETPAGSVSLATIAFDGPAPRLLTDRV